jgi:trimeric autotransporter adhesin
MTTFKFSYRLIVFIFIVWLLPFGAIAQQNQVANTGTPGPGSQNSFFGFEAGRELGVSSPIGNHNTLIGFWAGRFVKTGWHNMLLGSNAGRDNQNGSNNVCIGINAGLSTNANNTISPPSVEVNCSNKGDF